MHGTKYNLLESFRLQIVTWPHMQQEGVPHVKKEYLSFGTVLFTKTLLDLQSSSSSSQLVLMCALMVGCSNAAFFSIDPLNCDFTIYCDIFLAVDA